MSEASALSDQDLYLFNEGSHLRLYEKLGAHATVVDGKPGTRFAVWAPNAEFVSVVGDWNGWNRDSHPLHPRDHSGIWEAFIPDVGLGAVYKFHIRSRVGGYRVDKADPFAVRAEVPPRTASVVWNLDYAVERQGVARSARAEARPRRAHLDLRAPPRLVAPRSRGRQPLALLPRDRRAARRLRARHGLHARRAAARHGASVLRIVGLPDHRLLRADQPLRNARRTSCT